MEVQYEKIKRYDSDHSSIDGGGCISDRMRSACTDTGLGKPRSFSACRECGCLSQWVRRRRENHRNRHLLHGRRLLRGSGGICSAAADKLGWEITLLDAQGDPSTQADQMANLVSQGVDAIILNPTDTTSLLPSIQNAASAGIPVVGVGMEMDQECMDELLFFAGVDDYSLAFTGCDWIAQNYKDKGAQVALITGAAGTDPTNKTIQAFQDATAGTDIEYVGDFAGDFDSAKSMSITEDLMTKYPDLSVIYCQDHVMALGAASAVQDAQKADQIAIVGACGITDYLQYVEDGSVTSFGYVLLYQCGGFAVNQLAEYFKDTNTAFDAKYYAAPIVVTKDNVGEAGSVEFDFVAAK